MDQKTEPQVWERRPDEPDKAFQAFTQFRDAGPGRNRSQLAREGGVNRASWNRWAITFAWSERATAWDAHLDRINLELQAETYKRIKETHLKAAGKLVELGLKKLETLLESKNPKITPGEARKMIESGVRLERLIMGEPEEHTQTDHGISGLEAGTQLLATILDIKEEDL